MNGLIMFKDLLKGLNVGYGDTIFLHTSFKRISYFGLTAEQILYSIINTVGDGGTLVLPSYAWEKSWQGYYRYFDERPVMDIKNTPSKIGYIPETFRLMPEVKRSLSYWWPICAIGRLADEITKDQEKVVNYYGESSSFDLLRKNNVKILGLGVTLNTTSLCPIVDYRLGGIHPQKIFTRELQIGMVRDYSGNLLKTSSYWLLPDAVRLMKPSRVIDYSEKLKKAIYRKDKENASIQFCYEFVVYYDEAYRLALEAISSGKKIPWLENYEYNEKCHF